MPFGACGPAVRIAETVARTPAAACGIARYTTPKNWQATMAALLLVAEHDGPTMFARISALTSHRMDDFGRCCFKASVRFRFLESAESL
jgi:hypothetical protein